MIVNHDREAHRLTPPNTHGCPWTEMDDREPGGWLLPAVCCLGIWACFLWWVL